MPSQGSGSPSAARGVRRGLLASALLALLSTLPSGAQQRETRIKRDVDLVLLEATVKDKGGHILADLKKEDFRLADAGQPQEIAHFSRDVLPLALALVVQRSSWVQPFMQPLRYATLSALKALKPEDQVALFTFDDDVDRRVDLTSDKSTIADQIEVHGKGLGTNINDAVYQAANYLRDAAPKSRRVVLLVSDNMPADCKPGVSHKLVLENALENDTAVYSLKLPYRGPFAMAVMSKLAEHWLINVSKLTAETGGEVIDLEKEGSLYLAFQTILTRLKTRYTLGFYPADKAEDGRFRKLDLELAPGFGSKGRDYLVVAKSGYYAPRPRVASQ